MTLPDSDGRTVGEEVEIVWLRDPARFTYLREGVYATTRPQARIAPKLDHLVLLAGYAVHRPRRGKGTTVYFRRFWWLKDYDRDLDSAGVYKVGYGPTEATDPGSIVAGRPSRRWIPPAAELRSIEGATC